MGRSFGLGSGAIVIGTDKGLLQIYLKNGKSIVTLESSRNLVTYAKSFELKNVISPFASLISKIVPNSIALKVVGNEFGRRSRIILEDNNDKLMLVNEGIKKGRKLVSFSTYSNNKVDNLFDEYSRNPEIFSGFCNYKIDSLGNIDDRELDLVKKMFTPKYTLKDLDQGEKQHEALIKSSATEKYLDKIYKEYTKDHDEDMDDIKRIGFKKVKNMFGEVNEALGASKKDDLIDTLDRARTSIVARNNSIPNLIGYVNDSRLEGLYSNEDVSKALALIYVKEKVNLFDVKSHIEEKFDLYEEDKKLVQILEEDIALNYKKENRINFEDMIPIQFVRTREKISHVTEMEEAKIDGVLKRYVDLLESADYLNKSNDENDASKDELAVIIKNYENYLEEGVLSKIGISSGDGFITMFRNSIKSEIIRQKVDSDEIITFNHRTQDEDDVERISEYNYVVKDDKVHMLKDNMDIGIMEVSEMKDKYSRYMEESEVKKSSLTRLANKGNFIFIPEEAGVASIEQEYQCSHIIDDTIYMIKTCESEKDIRRAAFLKDIKQNLAENNIELKNVVDFDNIIYEGTPENVLKTIEDKIINLGFENIELLSEEDLEALTQIVEEHEEIDNDLMFTEEMLEKYDTEELETAEVSDMDIDMPDMG